MTSTSPDWQHRTALVNGVHLHYVEAGTGPLVLLLHGFPEFWYAWRKQIPALAGAGFHVVAPDLRGYNLSDKPRGVTNYRLETLTDDVAALIAQCGEGRAYVAGHDWGGVIAWNLAMNRPEAVEKLAILNAPHPAAFRRELRKGKQLLKSWYILYFQLPWLPEWNLHCCNFANFEQMFRRDPLRPDAFTDEDIAHYKSAFAQPGALTAALNYYRAGLRYRQPPVQRITLPTLLIWGEADRYLDAALTQGLEPWVRQLHVDRLPNVSHWVMSEAPEQVNRLLIEFFRKDRKEA